MSQVNSFSVYQFVKYLLQLAVDPDMIVSENQYLTSFLNWCFEREKKDMRLFFQWKKTVLETISCPQLPSKIAIRYLWTFLVWIETDTPVQSKVIKNRDEPFIIFATNKIEIILTPTPTCYDFYGSTLGEFFSSQDIIYTVDFPPPDSKDGHIYVPKNAFTKLSPNLNPKYLSPMSRLIRFILRDFERTPAFIIRLSYKCKWPRRS
ncbi:MAG: hypothetical protein LBE38_12035 [Deltaproteobacteria bacterium]|nr:hypothetical protein [Deltaproteobacteria bacterium]